jgi:tetratricopeptide (TPR) repeat protein
MPESAPPPHSTLDPRRLAFENAWQDRTISSAPPRWERFLPLAGQSAPPDFGFALIQTDIDFRIRAGLPALLAEPYFEHPRLQAPDAGLDPPRQADLVRWEYALRWRRGQRAARADYVARFPALAPALSELKPRWDCPGCGRAAVPLEDDTAASAGCPFCHETYPVDRLFPPDPLATLSPGPAPGPGLPAGLFWLLSGRTGRSTWPRPGPAAPWPAVPGYEIEGELGRGGMGVVYRARQVRARRTVALKMILAGSHAAPEELARFRTEAEAIARLQHPNVVQIYEVGEHEGLPFFSLEFCPGGALDKKLGGQPLPAREAAALLQTLARAMHAVHQVDVVHRDLKPGNVLLAADGTPKVTDFGLAKRLDETVRTRLGAVMGTPSYMAPEQARGALDQIGPATDVWALGAILYECLTGRPPFLAATPWDVLEQVKNQEPVPVRGLQPNVPRDLETICLCCLQKERGRRYAGAAALADDLGRFLAGEPVHARPVPAWERALKWARRRPTAAALAAAVAVAVVATSAGGLFYGLYKGQQATALDLQAAALRRQAERRQLADRLFGQGRDAEAAGRLALAGKNDEEANRQLAAAERHLEHAGAVLEEEEDELAAEIKQRRQRIRDDQDELDRRRQMEPRVKGFLSDLDQVRFHTVSATEQERTANAAAVRRLAGPALVRFGVSVGEGPAAAVRVLGRERGRFASDAQFRQVTQGCYELLLAWAEAEAEAGRLPGRPAAERRAGGQTALRLLSVAAALGEEYQVPVPQAYHQRRARYHAQAGDEGRAAAARAEAAGLRPRTALDHFLAAQEHFRRQRTGPAAAACAEVLRRQPEHFWALYLQSLCHLKARRWARAAAGFQACLARPGRGDFLWARLLRGVAIMELKEFETAEEDFDRALQKAAGPVERYVALTNRSVLRVRQHRYADAEADLLAATALRKDDYQAYLNLGEVYRRRHNSVRAAAALAGAGAVSRPAGADDLGRAVAALDLAVRCRPDRAELYLTRARLHLARQDWERARRDLEEAGRRARGSDPEREASRLVELGVLKDRAGEHAAALADFAAALKPRPDYAPAHRQRAQTLVKQGRHREAGAALDRYLRYGTPAAEAYLARGLIHSHLRQYQQAVRAYDLAVLLKDDAEARTQRGWAHLQLEAPRPALADFEAAERLRPGHPSSLCGRAYAQVLRGNVTAGVRDAEEALRQQGSQEYQITAACVYARAASLLALTPAKRGQRERPELRYEARAVELLDAALRRVPARRRASYWREHVRDEPALAKLRRHPRLMWLALGPGR